jgi:hypothetical protein
MKIILSNVFPYAIKVSRTSNWYDSGGTWYQYSTWLDEMFGQGEWEYSIGQFLFKREEDAALFKLRWK